MAGYSNKPLLVKLGPAVDGRAMVIAKSVHPDGALWVAWPKAASGIATDLTEPVVHDAGLRHGLVDVKVAALDDVWSGLKFVFRLKDRPLALRRAGTHTPRSSGGRKSPRV
jgi:hypothetical protein